MKIIKKTSLVLAMIPVLFSGCIQEKVSSVSPEKLTSQKIVNNEKNTSTQKNVQVVDSIVEDPVFIESSILDELAFDIQNSIHMDVIGAMTLPSLEVSADWETFSQKDDILETAKEYLGVEYIWAANGPSAFDCSGYTKYVFNQNGITIPRYSGHQAKVGIKVQYNELQEGDLVFFDTAKKSHGKVNHVGIYIGNDQFIHASSAKKEVMITSFTKKKFYKNRFLHGQRILDSNLNFAQYKKEKYTYNN